MPQYWITIHHPAHFDPSTESPAKREAISALNREMIAANIRTFVGGLHAPSAAHAILSGPGNQITVTPGPYLKTDEYVGGFWVLNVPTLEEALTWGRKAATACQAPVEVRPFH